MPSAISPSNISLAVMCLCQMGPFMEDNDRGLEGHGMRGLGGCNAFTRMREGEERGRERWRDGSKVKQ